MGKLIERAQEIMDDEYPGCHIRSRQINCLAHAVDERLATLASAIEALHDDLEEVKAFLQVGEGY